MTSDEDKATIPWRYHYVFKDVAEKPHPGAGLIVPAKGLATRKTSTPSIAEIEVKAIEKIPVPQVEPAVPALTMDVVADSTLPPMTRIGTDAATGADVMVGDRKRCGGGNRGGDCQAAGAVARTGQSRGAISTRCAGAKTRARRGEAGCRAGRTSATDTLYIRLKYRAGTG